jgi:hypothetical protein
MAGATAATAAARPLVWTNAWLAARYPFVWRTRSFAWIGLGALLAAPTFVTTRRTLDITTGALPNVLDTSASWAPWMYVALLAVFACVVDIVLRTDPIDSPFKALRFFATVSICTTALLMPQHLIVGSVIARIAALETDASMQRLVDTQIQHDFWLCVTDRGPLDANRAVIASDLRRYGFDTDFTLSPTGRSCPGDQPDVELKVWPAGGDPTSHGSGFLSIFEGRVQNIRAAREYIAGEPSLYDVDPIAHRRLVLAVALIAAAVATVFPATRTLRTRLFGGRRLIATRFAGAEWLAPFDVHFASNAPTIWGARAYHLGRWLLLSGGLAYLVGAQPSLSGGSVILMAAIVIGGLVVMLGTQERMRYLSTRLRSEVLMLVFQSTIIVAATSTLFAVFGSLSELGIVGFTVTCWLALAFSGALQTVRCGSWRTAFAGIIAGPVLLVALNLATASLGASDNTFFLGMAADFAILALLLWYAARVETRPTIRRIAIAAFMTIAPFPGIYYALNVALLDLPWRDAAVGILLSAATSILALILTNYDRHAMPQ